MDHEIAIHPRVDDTDLKRFEGHLTLIEQHMARIVGLAQKVQLPSGGGGSGGASVPGGGGGSGGGGGGTNASERAVQYVHEQMPPRAQAVHGRQSRANASMNSGQFLTNFQSIIEPILPQLDEMMQQPGGKPSATSALRQHLNHVQRIAAQPAGSSAESAAILQANQATGVDPGALTAAAAQYRATQPTHGAVISAYLQAQQQAAGVGPTAPSKPGGSSVVPVVQRLAGAVGLGELGGLVGGGLAATGVGVAALGVGLGVSRLKQGWSTYLTQGTAFSALSKTLGDLGESFNTLRNRVDATSVGFAESLPTITAATQALAPYVGNVGTGGLSRYMRASQGMAYSMGLNPVSTSQAFGQMAQLGILGTNSTQGTMTANQFAALIGNAVSAGSMQGRQGQVLSAMLSVSQQLASQLGQAPNANLLAAIMTSLNSSGNAVLQGTMGAQVISSINQGIQSPGLGSAGALATYQALNPNNKLGYFQEQYLQNQGINGVNPLTGQSNFSAMMQYFQKMLPGGRVTGTTSHGVWMPSEQSAAVGAMMGQDLHLTQSQALNVLKAMQGRSVRQENATQKLANQLGPGALNTIISKGGIYALGEIANASGVSGKTGLNAIAHQITHTLHGHVSSQYTKELQQYQQLGRIQPRNMADAQSIQHQRALDLAHMKTSLAQSLQGGPKLGTSLDNLQSTMAAASKNWASIARNLTPIREQLAKLNEYLSGGNGGTTHNPFRGSGQTPLQMIQSHPAYRGMMPPGATTAYTLPGLPATSTQGNLSATLAGFVQGNNQQTYLSALMALLRNGVSGTGGGGGNNPSRAINAGYNPGGGGPLPTTTAAVTQYNPLINSILKGTPGKNPLLTTNLVDAVMTWQNNAGNPNAVYHDPNGTEDAGLMQINSSNWQATGIAQDPFSVTGNLTAGIKMLNQLLNQYGSIGAAAYHYAGSGPLATKEANQLMAILAQIERNTRGSPSYGSGSLA